MNYCSVGAHPIRGDVCRITDATQIKFVQRLTPHFCKDSLLCKNCNDQLMKAYRYKVKRAFDKLKADSASSVPYSSNSQDTSDDYDSLIHQTPKNPHLKPLAKNKENYEDVLRYKQNLNKRNKAKAARGNQSSQESGATSNSANSVQADGSLLAFFNASSNSSSSNDAPSVRQNSQVQAQSQSPAQQPAEQASDSSLFEGPSTSKNARQAAAAAKATKRKATSPATKSPKRAATAAVCPAVDLPVTADDGDEMYSLNYFNGTRLPNVQPIIRTRVIQVQGDVMDLYTRDITGG